MVNVTYRLKRLYYINEAFKLSKLLLEDDDTHHYEWDLVNNKFHDRINNTVTDIETNLKKASKYVSNGDEALEYLQNVVSKLGNLPLNLKKRVFNFAMLSVLSFLSYNQIVKLSNDVTIGGDLDSDDVSVVKDVIKKVIVKKNNDKVVDIYTRPTTYSDSLLSFLRWEEGSLTDKGEPVTTAYNIGDGMITVGYGHAEPVLGTVRVGGVNHYKSENMVANITKISEKTANDLLIKDVEENVGYINDILNAWDSVGIKPKITQGMFDAMVSMSFNMGIGNLRKSDFIQSVKRGDFNMAKKQILTTNVTYPGHVERRKKESAMFGN